MSARKPPSAPLRLRPIGRIKSTLRARSRAPIGLHVVHVRRLSGRRLRIGPIEAIDGTPIVDLKPVLR